MEQAVTSASNPQPGALPWMALYVKHRHEKSVASSLDSKGIPSFLPLYAQRHGSGKVFDLPLFPGYVFCELNEKNLSTVRSTPGVFTVVGHGREPASISPVEIDSIRQTVYSKLKIEPWPYVGVGDEVCLKSGPLRGISGMLVNNSHERWLVLSVHLLQRSIAVKVERTQLE